MASSLFFEEGGRGGGLVAATHGLVGWYSFFKGLTEYESIITAVLCLVACFDSGYCSYFYQVSLLYISSSKKDQLCTEITN